jgi:hypothetical protein
MSKLRKRPAWVARNLIKPVFQIAGDKIPAMAKATREEFYARLRATGLPGVRAGITTGVYLGAEKVLAQAWADQELERLREADSFAQIRMARGAKNAAWIAAMAAIIAAICAIVSIWPQISAIWKSAAPHR